MLNFPAFVHQSDGFIYLSDGISGSVVFQTLADFVDEENGYALPENAVGLNYEKRTNRTLFSAIMSDGSLQIFDSDDGESGEALAVELDSYIAKIPTYAAAIAEKESQFYGVNVLADAQSIAHAAVAEHFEFLAAGLVNGKWSQLERETFETQYAEAKAYDADNAAATPFLDAIIAVEGGTKADLAAAVITNGDALKNAVAPLVGAKRKHLAAIYALPDAASVKAYDVTADWS